MLTNKDIAEVYRIGLVVGLFEVKEVVQWADGVIAKDADPDYALIEVSMASDANEGQMASLLQAVGGEKSGDTPREVVFGLLGRKLATDPGAAGQVASQVKAIEQSEGASGRIGADLRASLVAFEAKAAEWSARG